MGGTGAHDHLVDARLAHDLLLAGAVLLGPLLEVEVVEGAHHLPEVRLVIVAKLVGHVAHDLADDATVGAVELALVIAVEQLERLLRSGNHGEPPCDVAFRIHHDTFSYYPIVLIGV